MNDNRQKDGVYDAHLTRLKPQRTPTGAIQIINRSFAGADGQASCKRKGVIKLLVENPDNALIVIKEGRYHPV